jgi:hypothetical protein
VNGVKIGEDLVGNIPPLSNAGFSGGGLGSTPFYGHVKIFALSKEVFTDQECINLTT